MRNRVVTVFGGSGQIGRYVVARLAERQALVRVPSRNPPRSGFLRPMGAVGQIVIERLSLGSDEALLRHIEGAYAIVNLVAILHGSKAHFEALHTALPERLGRLAGQAGVQRLVHVSAIGADPGAGSLYASTKGKGELALREAFPDATILRPSIVFGPEDQFFNRFARMAQLSPVLPLIGGGRTRFQPVYVCDVAGAIMAALLRDDAPGRTYELGGPKVYSFEELMRYMLKVLGRRRLLVNLPWAIARLQARLMELLPEPPLTRDQVEMLKTDNVVAEGALGLADLEITPTPLEVIVPDYLRTYASPAARMRQA
jgi:uncharacterized protein YbjT (DUF2867 family)